MRLPCSQHYNNHYIRRTYYEHEASASNEPSNGHAAGNYMQNQPTITKHAPPGEEGRADTVE